jgi:hypothetical protein
MGKHFWLVSLLVATSVVAEPKDKAPPAKPPAPKAQSSSVPEGARVVPGTGKCSKDEDCHAATACHATSCTSKPVNYPPVFCTQDCNGPMDCGQGGCACVNGSCAMYTREKKDSSPDDLLQGH